MLALVALLAAGAAAGLVLLVGELRGVALFPPRTPARRREWRLDRRWVVGLPAAFAVAVGTRWPVAGLFTLALCWIVPMVFGQSRVSAAATVRIEAIATWTEMLRDLLAGSGELEQVIVRTADISPAPIRPHVQALARRLTDMERLDTALQRFADDVDNPAADTVVTVLLMSSRHGSAGLGEVLRALSLSIREQVSMRLRVEAKRAEVRAAARGVTVFSIGFAVLFVVFSRPYFRPLDTPAGQVVLAVAVGCFLAGLVAMARMARISDPPRVLAFEPPLGEGTRR